MRIRSLFYTLIFICSGIALCAGLYFAALRHSIPSIAIEHRQNVPLNGGKSLPFYEVMSPIPSGPDISFLPKIDYKKGPPDRYIEKVSLLFLRQGNRDKERIIYYGRRTSSDWWLSTGMALLHMNSESGEANFLAAAIEFALQGTVHTDASAFALPILKLAMLKVASPYLAEANRVEIMDQAGTPAFLFFYAVGENEQQKASAYFFRRNSQFHIDYLADHQFQILAPEELFSKSFLVAKRQDALGFVAQNLSEVHFGAATEQNLAMHDLAWPLALLAATLSVDPSSLDAYFHFAGLNALLFKSKGLDTGDIEMLDTIRSNVLAAGFYSQDVAPQSEKAAEVARLARTLTRNLE